MEKMEETTPTETAPVDMPPAGSQDGRSVVRTIGIIAAVVVLLAIVGALLYGLASHPPFTAVLRDIAIIVLALVTIITGVFLAILLIQLQSLIVLLRDEVYPILESLNQTAGTVRGTTTFVSDAVVTPMITAASYASAVRQTIRTLTGSPSRQRQPRQGPEQE
jgi:hypothetical protein